MEVAPSDMVPWEAVLTSFLFQAFCLNKFRKILIRSLCSHLSGSAWCLPSPGAREPCSGSAHPSQGVWRGTEPDGPVPRAGSSVAGAGDPTNTGKQSKERGSP